METDGEVRNKVEFKLLTLIVTNCNTSRKTGWGQGEEEVTGLIVMSHRDTVELVWPMLACKGFDWTENKTSVLKSKKICTIFATKVGVISNFSQHFF